MPDLTTRIALVTGGGRGIGRGVAIALAVAGADLAVAGRTRVCLEAVADEIHAIGRRCIVLEADVTRPGDPDRLVEETVEQLGGLDVVVNNSGVMHIAPALDTSDEDWDRVVSTNLTGTFRLARAAGRHLTAQGSGKIVNVASYLGLRGERSFAAYCATKAAVINLTRVLAVEWARFGVQVNAVAPGFVETDMNASLRMDAQLLESELRGVPARRMGRVEEVGAAVAYLASPLSDYVTGTTLVIDGGALAG